MVTITFVPKFLLPVDRKPENLLKNTSPVDCMWAGGLEIAASERSFFVCDDSKII